MDRSLQEKRWKLQPSDCYRGLRLGVQTQCLPVMSLITQSEDDEVLVSEEEEVEEVDESAFEKLINSSLEQSRQYIPSAP